MTYQREGAPLPSQALQKKDRDLKNSIVHSRLISREYYILLIYSKTFGEICQAGDAVEGIVVGQICRNSSLNVPF